MFPKTALVAFYPPGWESDIDPECAGHIDARDAASTTVPVTLTKPRRDLRSIYIQTNQLGS